MQRPCNAKIVATLGPASADRAIIESFVRAGADVFRLNFSHGTHADHKQRHAVFKSEQRDGFVGGRRPAEEIDEQAALAGVLVGERGQDPVLVQHFLNSLEVAVLGQHLPQPPRRVPVAGIGPSP